MWVLWIAMAIVVALIAHAKGRSAVGWFFYGLLLWPVALVHILLKPATVAAARAKRAEEMTAEGRTPCPYCAEPIKREAKLCPHCRTELPPPEPRFVVAR